MGKFDNIYPRGVVIDWERSPVRFHPGGYMPEAAQEHAVFWLTKNGILYKTMLDALYWDKKVHTTDALKQGEKAFYHSNKLATGFVEIVREEEATFEPSEFSPSHYYRVSTIDVPFALPVSTKPGDHSTIWISKSDRAYATRKLALEDDSNKAIGSLALAAGSIADALSEFLFGTAWGWLLLVIAGLLILRMFKKTGSKQLAVGSRQLAGAPAN
jgi:hypothetical protein